MLLATQVLLLSLNNANPTNPEHGLITNVFVIIMLVIAFLYFMLFISSMRSKLNI